MRVGDAVAVVDYGEGPVASVFKGGGDVDALCAGVGCVAQKLEEGVFEVGDAGGRAAGAFDAGQAGEARAEVPVGAFHPYLATSLTRLSRMTVTLIWPGYSRSVSICLEMS